MQLIFVSTAEIVRFLEEDRVSFTALKTSYFTLAEHISSGMFCFGTSYCFVSNNIKQGQSLD